MPHSPDHSKVVVTVTLQKQLRDQLKKNFRDDINFLIQKWEKEIEIYGNIPEFAIIDNILHANKTINCDYELINKLCQILLYIPYRNRSNQTIHPPLKQQIKTAFKEKFTQKKGISWSNFNQVWSNQFNDPEPPCRQTLDAFFNNDERDTCEQWIMNGLCQLLLGCSFENWINQNSDKIIPFTYINSPNLDGEIRWVGREEIVNNLKTKLTENTQDCRIVSIVGLTGIGKTSLAARLMVDDNLREFCPSQKVISFDCDDSSFDLIPKALLGEQALFSASSQVSSSTNQSLSSQNDVINALVAFLRSRSCLVILDMIEEMLSSDQQGTIYFKDQRFQTFFEQVLKSENFSSRIIITSQDKLPSLAEGRYYYRYHQEVLKGLEMKEALALFQQWDINAQSQEEYGYLKRIITVYEGHPLALRVIAAEMRLFPYDGEVTTYWDEYGEEIEQAEKLKSDPENASKRDHILLDRYSPNLKDLVKIRIEKTFRRLLATHPLAHRLLCMGAVYRQAVERKAWLMMIDENDPEEQKIAFDTLKIRFLLETEKSNGQTCYRLHNLIRRVALDNLLELEDDE